MNHSYEFPVRQRFTGDFGDRVHPLRGPAILTASHAALSAAFALFLSAASFGQAKSRDRDGDGIPGEWEALRGTSDRDASDALVDFDGDGLTTYMEYLTQGRPWGNYEVHRFPWKALPASVPFQGVTGTEIIGANRSGEYLVNCYDAAGPHTFLWTPVPGAPLAALELTPLPATLAAGTLWNDLGQALLPEASAGSGEIRSLRKWQTPPVSVSWNAKMGQTPVALSNDGQLLLHWQERGPIPSPSLGATRGLFDNFQWSGASGESETLSFGRDPSVADLLCGSAADLDSGAWILGAFGHHPRSTAPESFAWRLPPAGMAETLPPLPRGLHGAAFHAAAAEKAVGTAHRDDGGPDAGVLFDALGWHTISGGAAGPSSVLFGVSDTGVILGLNSAVTSGGYFLWQSIAVSLTKARPEIAAGFVPAGLTASGALYGLDFGKGTTAPQPVVFRPLASVPGDGAAEPSARPLTDSDRDGIPDANERAAGTSATLVDSDGDGSADLWDLISQSTAGPTEASATAPGPHTGLEVFSPGHHPLARHRLAIP